METKINDRLTRIEQMVEDLHRLLLADKKDDAVKKAEDMIDSGMSPQEALQLLGFFK